MPKQSNMRLYKIVHQETLRNTYWGNPRYEFLLHDEEAGKFIKCRTKGDYSFVYGVLNNAPYVEAELKETPSGRVYMVNANTNKIKRGEEV